MKKKGILFTIGLSAVALTLLALSIMIFNNFQTSEERFSKLAVFDRAYDLDISVQGGLRKIFYAKSGISIIKADNKIVISEDLPNSNRAAFANETSNFKNFVESNFDNINLIIGDLNSYLTLTITPFKINYTHNEDGDKIFIIYNENVSSIELYFWDNFSNGTVSFDVENPGSLEVKIISGSFGWHDEETDYIDPTEENEAGISGLSGADIKIDFDQNRIDIGRETGSVGPILSKVTLGFINNSENAGVVIPNIINISFDDFGISKQGSVKIL